MRCVTFQNPGVIDQRAYSLFGASAKEGSNPIGFFGTGLKYSIAIFLRLGCKVELWRGLERTEFSSAPIKMRDSEFLVVMAHEEGGSRELPYTTGLGKTWKAWQALRELWCNALDEGGEMQAVSLEPREGHTTIRVTGNAVVEAWMEREKIMITSRPVELSEGVEIHLKPSSAIYFRGIKVLELNKPSALTYDIVGHPIELTEDRSVKYVYYAYCLIARAIARATNEQAIRAFLEAGDQRWEHSLDVSEEENPSAAFMEVLEHKVKLKAKLSSSVLKLFLSKRGYALRAEEKDLTEPEKVMLRRAIRFCESVGLDINANPIKVTDTLEDNVLGRADRIEGVVWITKRAFMLGTKVVAGTLMEEMIHMQRGLHDETRSLQNYLVDMVVSMHERITGEPL